MVQLEQLEQLEQLGELGQWILVTPVPFPSTIDLLVLQASPFCNLDCGYCYLPDRANKRRMSTETLRAVGETIVASPLFTNDTTLLWHAGEPCAVPALWYHEACKQITRTAKRQIPKQAFQTNATCMTDDWLAYFAMPGVSVGVSLDGPADINDHWRTDRRGQGTFARSIEGIARLRTAGIRFHVICVVSAASLDHPERIAEALAATGAYSLGLSVEENEGVHGYSTMTGAFSDRYATFLKRFVARLDEEPAPPHLREMDWLASGLQARRAGQRLRNQENTPGAIISVSSGGGISSFSPELLGLRAPRYNNFIFGNVHSISDVSAIFLSRAFMRCQGEISRGVAACRRGCAYFGLCGGGSPSNKFGEHARFDVTETNHCKLGIQTTCDTLMDVSEEHLRTARKEVSNGSR